MNKLKSILFLAIATGILTSCVNDDDTSLPNYEQLKYSQDFNEGADNTTLVTPGWVNFAQEGTAVWKIQQYSGNGYAEFSSFQSGNATNVAWLISPAIALEENNSNTLRFQVAQSYVTSAANKLEVFVSEDFDGTDVAGATWTAVNANTPGISATYFEFMDSGEISLSGFSGNVHIGYKVTGSGTNTALDGSYQIDNVRVY